MSFRHPEDHVALERSPGCRHLDRAGSRARWHVGRDQGSRNHFEDRRGAVKCDASCAGQIRSQNLDSRSYLAGGRLCFHKRAQTYRQAEDRAVAAGPAEGRCPVELPIGALDQRRFGAYAVRAVEVVQRRQFATWRDLEERAIGPASDRCSVEIPIGGLDQRSGGERAVCAVEAV